MTGGVRALLGAAIGAVLTLIAHPLSRPYLVSAWRTQSLGSYASLPGVMPSYLGVPKDSLDYCLWMQAASERLDSGRVLSRTELNFCVKYAKDASQSDPKNGFWLQMLAAFQWQQGDRDASIASLSQASICTYWNDLQTKRLGEMESEIQRRFGTAQSWQYGRVYALRSVAPAHVIATMLRKYLDLAPLQDANGRNLRYIVLENAALIMENAKSISVFQIGSELVDRTYYPYGILKTSSQHRLIRYKDEYVNRLARVNPAYAEIATTIYKKNESMNALLEPKEAPRIAENLCLLSIIVASVSGALIATAAIGLFLWSVGVLMTRGPLVLKAIQFPGVVIVAVLLTSVTFTITQLTTAAMAIGGCALIAGLTPKHERTLPPSDLGPLFSLVTRCLALLFMASLSAYFISRSTPAHEVLDSMTPINEWWPSQSSLLGLSLLVLSTLLLAAPMWAFAQRIRTASVLTTGLRSFGVTVAVCGLLMGVLACPISIYGDHVLSDKLYELVTNEPLHYYRER